MLHKFNIGGKITTKEIVSYQDFYNPVPYRVYTLNTGERLTVLLHYPNNWDAFPEAKESKVLTKIELKKYQINL